MASKEDSTLRCEPCDSVFEDADTYERHVKSSSHRAQMMNMERLAATDDDDSESSGDDDHDDKIICNLCHKSFSGIPPYKQHLKSAQHFKQVEKDLMIRKLKKDPKKQKDIREKDGHADAALVPEEFASCSVCKKKFSGPESYQQHMRSKKHARKVEEENFMQNLKEKDDIDNIMKFLPKNTSTSVSQKLLDEFKEKLTTGDPSDETEQIYCCKDCNKAFSGLIPYAQHMISMVHEKKVKQNQLLQSLTTQALADAMNSNTEHKPHSPSATDACARRARFIEDILCCDICHMAFSGPESVKAHLKSRGHQKKLEIRKFKAKLKNENSGKSSKSKSKTMDDTSTVESSASSSPDDVQKFVTPGVDDDNGTCELSEHELSSDSAANACLEEDSSLPVIPRRKRQSSVQKVSDTVKEILEEEY